MNRAQFYLCANANFKRSFSYFNCCSEPVMPSVDELLDTVLWSFTIVLLLFATDVCWGLSDFWIKKEIIR